MVFLSAAIVHAIRKLAHFSRALVPVVGIAEVTCGYNDSALVELGAQIGERQFCAITKGTVDRQCRVHPPAGDAKDCLSVAWIGGKLCPLSAIDCELAEAIIRHHGGNKQP
jgi:hypothetical protein